MTEFFAIYNNLIEGAGLNISPRRNIMVSAQRPSSATFMDIRNFLSEKRSADGSVREVQYDRANDNYRIVGCDKLSPKEIFALCKVVLKAGHFLKKNLCLLLKR